MHQVTQPIHLPSYPQQNPLPHYQNQPHQLFHTIIQNIQQDVSNYIFKSLLSLQHHLQTHKTTDFPKAHHLSPQHPKPKP
ncbi:hypothetical protein, partial [Staphylococcus saprophyticus]|uniref:hypothetical protein n=1 Tax=Staphylococcus saprophyticus TaxID=29385 RepID=UPI0037040CC4